MLSRAYRWEDRYVLGQIKLPCDGVILIIPLWCLMAWTTILWMNLMKLSLHLKVLLPNVTHFFFTASLLGNVAFTSHRFYLKRCSRRCNVAMFGWDLHEYFIGQSTYRHHTTFALCSHILFKDWIIVQTILYPLHNERCHRPSQRGVSLNIHTI